MSIFWLVLASGFQAATGIPDLDPGVLTDTEKVQLDRERSVESRIRIYSGVSARFQETIKQDFQQKTFDKIPNKLTSWLKLLTHSLQDIEKNVDRKKKSKNLIHCEIQLRKALAEIKEYRLKSPQDLDPEYEAFLTQAEVVRRTFVDILFLR